MDAFNRMHKDTGECELLAKCVLKPKFKENGVSQVPTYLHSTYATYFANRLDT